MENQNDRPGTGVVFKNYKYTDGGNQPYARGYFLTPEGEKYEIALWVPRQGSALKGFNLSIQEPWEKRENNASVKKESDIHKTDDDLPF